MSMMGAMSSTRGIRKPAIRLFRPVVQSRSRGQAMTGFGVSGDVPEGGFAAITTNFLARSSLGFKYTLAAKDRSPDRG